MSKLIDLTGQKYGRLTVLYRAESRNGKTYWHCKCECGREKDVQGMCLKDGRTKSCGCLNSEVASNRQSKDYTGQKFGMLTVLERLKHYKGSYRTYYRCLCDCGNTKIISSSGLVSKSNKGILLNCGCMLKNHEYLSMKHFDGRNDKKYSVYKHTFPNEKIYIGITKNNVTERWKNGTGYDSQTLMKRAIEKYGWDSIYHEILEDNLTHDEACSREEYYIKLFKTNNRKYGYNITFGGDSGRNIVNPVIQYYKGEMVNCFESLTVASKLLDLSSTTIRNYAEGKCPNKDYSFEVLEPIFDYKVDDIFYNFRNNEHLHIKDDIQKIISTKTIERNKKTNRRINQYTLQGKYIRTFNSIKEAMLLVPHTKGLSRVLSEEYVGKSAGGFLWRYDNGDYSDIESYHANGKRICQIDIKTNKIINIFESMSEAERKTGISSKQIWKVCNGKREITGGYIWKYADEVDLVA